MSDLHVQRYHAHPEEVVALRRLSHKWRDALPATATAAGGGRSAGAGSFWEFDEVLATLASKGSALIYARYPQAGEDELTPQKWAGCVIYQQVFERTDLMFIFVLPEERRKQVARALLTHMLSQLKQAGQKTQVFLEVADGNTAAIALYRALGFAEVGRRPKYYRDGRDGIVMSLTWEHIERHAS